MNRRQSVLSLLTSLALIFGFLTTVPNASAADEQVLYSFRNGADGGGPFGPVVFDAAGNLYGTTQGGGGPYGWGTVFRLSPGANGAWTETILYRFSDKDALRGAYPMAGLVFDSSGNLYGTTSWGGAWGYGTVFKLTPGSDDQWTEQLLYSFSGVQDGSNPFSTLVFDAAGNLYGTTMYGGDVQGIIGGGYGTVFELSPTKSGAWREKVLYAFHGPDGALPRAGIVFDASGDIYGGTVAGGLPLCNITCGVVYKLTPTSNGGWTETVLHRFDATDGMYNESGVVLDGAGNLWGTTFVGGQYGGGTVFRLSPGSDGQWNENYFSLDGTDGFATYGGPVFDAAGNVYVAASGSTNPAGGGFYFGDVFELTLESDGEWADTVLHYFAYYFDKEDGANPASSLIFDAKGNLYGTTTFGGLGCAGGDGCGTVYEVTP
jgi:uncharacterized repeat protein (TIGR03803 family)